MKTNKILYILLIVLLIMNGFFLFNYLGRPSHKGPKASGNFIVKELKFNKAQLEQYKALEDKHHNAMRAVNDATKDIKNKLFQQITQPNIDQAEIDNLILLISEKERLKEKELFNRLRRTYELCDAQQKVQFSSIIKYARKFDGPPSGPRKH